MGDAGGRSSVVVVVVVVVVETMTGDAHDRRNARVVVEAKMEDGPSHRNVGTVTGEASGHDRTLVGGRGDIFRVVVISVVGRSGHAHVEMYGGCTTACVIANEGAATVAHVLENGMNRHHATG
jgi:hypothetical protein